MQGRQPPRPESALHRARRRKSLRQRGLRLKSSSGGDLFEGKIRFANGGPSCNACHHVKRCPPRRRRSGQRTDPGVLAHGQTGVSAILGNSPFPVMQAAYAGKEFSDKEINALVGFLQHVDQGTCAPDAQGMGVEDVQRGRRGVVVLLGIFGLAGRRPQETVRESGYLRPADQIGVIVRVTTSEKPL